RRWVGESTEQKLREAEAQNVHLTDQLRATALEAEAMRVQLLKERQRFANGVCPCCNRSFTNVARHMRTQHPDYDHSRVEGKTRFECSCGSSFASLHGLRVHQGRQRHDGWEQPSSPRWRAHLTVVSA